MQAGGFSTQNCRGQCTEFQFFENLGQFFTIKRIQVVVRFVKFDRHIRFDGGQFFGEECLILVLEHFFLLFGGEFIRVGDDSFDAAELLEPFDGCLGSHARDAGNVVDGVAGESEHINDLIHTVDIPIPADFSGAELLDTVALSRGLIHHDLVADQLGVVLVGSHHIDCVAGFRGLLCDGSDYVIGFEIGHGDDRNFEGADDVHNDGQSYFDIVGLFFPVRLVWLVHFIAKGRPRRVKCHGNMRGCLFLNQVPQRPHKTRNGGDIQAFGVNQWSRDKGKMRPVHQCVAIQ